MKESKYKIKVVCGFRKEQEFTIDANEAHKAYYLFNNPEKRGTFNNGLAIKGLDIQRIEPDYNATMGWNHTYQLTNDDWNELNSSGVVNKLRVVLSSAKEIAKIGELSDFTKPLIDLVRNKYPYLTDKTGSEFSIQFLEEKKKKLDETD